MSEKRSFSPEVIAKLRMARASGIGPVTYRRIMLRYANSAQHALEDWYNITRGKTELASETAVRTELENLFAAGGWMVVWGDDDYPPQLAELADPPVVISGLGNKAALAQRQVAIVGNRNASATGLAWTRQAASELACAGLTVTSGLARGIDTAAHEGALAAGGQTLAVVAGGVDHIYPPENALLREKIIAGGCVISEQPWGTRPNAHLFPRRNRIIAGLSLGIVVSEATRHSGSLITAEHALEYGREVWAVPGSPNDLRSGGPNWLLKNGAALIESAADVIGQLPKSYGGKIRPLRAQAELFDTVEEASPVDVEWEEDVPSDDPSRMVETLLGTTPISFDELVRQTGLREADVSGILIELEINGRARREGDGRWRK